MAGTAPSVLTSTAAVVNSARRMRALEYTALLFRVADRVSCALLYLVVALAPLPRGSTEPVTVAIWCIVLGVTVILAAMLDLHKTQLVFIGLGAFIAAAYGVVLHEHLS